MENVTIVGTESGVLVLATESGERFALPIDDLLRAEIRRAGAHKTESAPRLAASPKEIQAHIRSGLTAAEVAELLGVDLAVVTRFEGPVLAEREHVVGQALAVPVLIGSEVEPDAQPTFGTAIRAKLAEVAAVGERWASWKDDSGWVVKLEFTANEIDHDARWTFDPRRSTLAPLNSDATQLSRQGSLPDGLIPRLRAVEADRPASPYKDETRFDSGAFGLRPLADPEADLEEPPVADRAPTAAQHAAIKRAPEESTTSAETADLLEALRRRRGQREAAPLDEEEPEQTTANSPIALFDALEPGYAEKDEAPEPDPSSPAPSEPSGRKRRRNAMPSWDEIVFGARSDE
ncbi:septation protein SepH [Microbacterium sp. NPDC055903]